MNNVPCSGRPIKTNSSDAKAIVDVNLKCAGDYYSIKYLP